MPNPWTDQEKNTLKKVLETRKAHTLDWVKLKQALPKKSRDAIYRMIGVLGLQQRNWPEKHKALLISLWGQVTPRQLRSRFKDLYSWDKVLKQADGLGLSRDLPRGMVSIHSLGKNPKWGYDYDQTLRVLKWSEVPVHNFAYEGNRPRYCVDEFEAQEAAENWARSECLKDASLRLGVPTYTIRRWLEKDGRILKNRKHIRFYPNVYDGLLKKYGSTTLGSPQKKKQQIYQDGWQTAA